jgi:hypothetical protein
VSESNVVTALILTSGWINELLSSRRYHPSSSNVIHISLFWLCDRWPCCMRYIIHTSSVQEGLLLRCFPIPNSWNKKATWRKELTMTDILERLDNNEETRTTRTRTLTRKTTLQKYRKSSRNLTRLWLRPRRRRKLRIKWWTPVVVRAGRNRRQPNSS